MKGKVCEFRSFQVLNALQACNNVSLLACKSFRFKDCQSVRIKEKCYSNKQTHKEYHLCDIRVVCMFLPIDVYTDGFDTFRSMCLYLSAIAGIICR